MHLQSNTVFDLNVGAIGHMRCCPVHAISSVIIFLDIMCPMHLQILKLLRLTVLKKMRFQETTLFYFYLGHTEHCPVSYIQLQILKLLRLMVQEEMHLHKNTLFDLCPWLRNFSQYPLYHADYAATKFKVAAANGLGDTLSRNRTHERARTRMGRQTDRTRRINVHFFQKEAKLSILWILLQNFKGHIYFIKFCHHRNNQYMS